MSDCFVKLLNMSITAGWVVLAVVVLRLLLKRAPRWITCLLWGAVALRLVCPFSLQSVTSLIPSKETIPPNIAQTPVPEIHTGIDAVNFTVNPYLQQSVAPTPTESVNPLDVWLTVATWVWITGVCAMLLYGALSYWRLKRRVRVSIPVEKGVYVCDDVASPFIFGVFRPRIYLPSGLSEEVTASVLAHERAHLKRGDHWIKPFGFLLLAVYWFHPLLWVAYLLLCRDIETACDEKVVKEMDTAARQAYSTALVNCSAHRRTVMLCPLAFGEVGVKARVKAVLNYKRPAFWIILVAVIAAVAVAVCFLTDPKTKKPDGVDEQVSGASREGVTLTVVSTDLDSLQPTITVQWENGLDEEITFGNPFTLYRKVDGEWQNCVTMDLVWTLPAYILKAGNTTEKVYSLVGQSVIFPGDYRLEADFSVGDAEETAWVEFHLTRGTSLYTEAVTFRADELLYANPFISFVLFPENAPAWRVVNGHMLYEIASDNLIKQIGVLNPITLTEENFDFQWPEGSEWREEPPKMEVLPTAEQIRKDNRYAWEIKTDVTRYVLLQQKDGTFMMWYGSFLYRLKTDKNPISLTQPAVDGAMFCYAETTMEHDIPTLSTYYAMNDEELQTLLADLESLSWIYDGLVDREELRLDGQVFIQNRWLYFGFEQKVIAYGTHIATMSDDVMAQLQAAKGKAVPYDGI